MEVEHSRLLKFFKEARKNKPEMAESQEIPVIKIQNDYQNPPNVEAEVPGTQKIREYDEKNNSSDTKITGADDANNSSEITVTGADFTLSPVITVTKNESTFTKGDLKLQKVTVTEDIADEESKNGGYKITREVESLTQTDRQADRTAETIERDTTNMEGEEKSQDEKKSKIPMVKLRQALEKVKKEREARKEREKPRRSSIPTLKDPKKTLKRDASLNIHPAVDDEFDKLYEEIVDVKQKDIEEKLPSVTMEDPEKIETKFEEIIHAYDEDEHEKHSVARVSKIPALKRKDEDGSSRITAMIDRAKEKTEAQLKDGGFKVMSSSIKTKRFSRGSRELSGEEHHVEITETIDIKEGGDNEVFVKETVKTVPAKPERFRNISKRVVADQKTGTVATTEIIEDSAGPIMALNFDKKDGTQNKTKKIIRTMSTERKERNLNRELSRNLENIRRKFRDRIEDARMDPEFKDNENHIIETTVTEITQDVPVKTEKIVRGISREISTDGKNINTTEKVTVVKHNNGESRTITTFSSEIPVRTEKIVRGISREMSKDGKTINSTETVTVEELNDCGTRTVTTIASEIPVRSEKIVRGISREKSIDGKNINTTEKVTVVKHNNGETRTITTIASEIPVRTEKIVRGISREISMDGKIHNTETVTVKDLNKGGTRTITTIASEIPVRTERIVRGISRDMSIDDKNIKSTETVVIEGHTQEMPAKTEKIVRGITREMSEDSKSINSTETVTVEELNDGGTRTITTKTTESLKVGTPVVTEKVIRNISREISTEGQNNIIKGVTTIEETIDGGSRKVIKETHVRENVSGIPVKTERFTRGISREMGNINLRRSREFLAAEAEYSIPSDNKQELRQESMKTEQIEKEGIHVGIPVFTKVTRSFSKGKIQNVEMSRTIEWQPADEVKTKNYSRSVSEKVTKKELKDTGKWKYEIPTAISEVTDVNNKLTERTNIAPKYPVLESKIKDTVKDIASKLTSKKITEYKTEEQVTNVEKTTYTLNSNVDLNIDRDIKASKEIGTQMSLDGKASGRNYKLIKEVGTQMSVEGKYLDSPFDRDFKLAKESIESKTSVIGGDLKTSKEIGTQMSIVGKIVDKDLKVSKEISTQMSLEGTKLIENSTTTKQTTITGIIHEKSEKENANLPTEDKDSDNEGVTILKGNVSRMKDKIAKKSMVVSKKDHDEEVPKKKSVLSKIAMFERLEPNEPYPVKAVPKVSVSKIKPKYTPPDLSRLNSADRPKIVDEILKEPTQNEPIEVTSKVEIGSNYDEVTYRTEPLSGKEYWRNEKRYGQNDLQQFNTETNENTTFNQQEVKDFESVKVLPEIVDFKTQESQIEVIKSVVNKAPIERESSVIEMPTIFPAKINYEADIGKIKPGKIDLNVWSSHVEINKHSVDRADLFREESLIEIAQTLPGKVDFKTNDSHVSVSKELPGTVGLKEDENQTHAVTILPAKIDFNSEEIARTLIKRLDSQIDERHASENLSGLTHDFRVDDVRQLPEIIDFESFEMQTETASTLPSEVIGIETKISKTLIGHAATENMIKRPKEFTNIKENLKPETNKKEINAKPKPGKINFSLWQSQVEVNKTLVGKTDLRKTKDAEIAKALSGRIDFKPKRKPRVTETVQSSNVLNSKENTAETAITSTSQVDQSLSRSLSEVASILPGKLDETENIDSTKSLVGFVDYNSNETQDATVKTLPEMISFAANQVEVAMTLLEEFNSSSNIEPKIISGMIEFEPEEVESKAEINETLLDNIYYSSTEYQTVKPTTLSAQNSVDRVGKLDLKAWEQQVEVNKTLVDKTNVVKGEHLEEIAKTLPDKINFISYETRVGQARAFQAPIDLNTDGNKVEITEVVESSKVGKILPEPIDLDPFKHTPRTNPIAMLKRLNSQDNMDLKGNVTKVQFPIESNPESEPIDLDPFKHTPRTNPITMLKRLNSQDNIDFKSNVAKVEFPIESNPETLSDPELIDENPIEVKQKRDVIIGNVKRKLYFITNNNSGEGHIKTPLNTPMPLESDAEHSEEKRVEEFINLDFVGLPPNETDTWTYINAATAKSYEITADTIEESNAQNITDGNNYSVAEYELDFDTFQVQSEFKNDSFVLDDLITSLTDLPHSGPSRTKTHNNKYVSNEFGFNFDVAKVGNQLSRSAYFDDDFKKSTEELKRAKSVAELDLGEAVHGQVKRIVGRIKSVDFSRRDSVKTEINVKELPRKMSVIEKIALFEGKTARARYESTTRKTSTTNKPSTTTVISEEEYLRKIEEITVGKNKFGRLEDMLYLPLADGSEIPVLALGTALVDPRLLPYLIGAAIDLGYRAIDTAYIYGNEREIGQAIKAKIDDGTVKREDLYIISKLWSTFHRSDLVEVACKASLENMGLDYFDLYLIHNPMSFKEGSDPIPKIATVLQYSQSDYLDAWFGMEGLVTKGLVKSIGVSNFNSQQIQRILDKGKVKPVVNQVECHPYLSQQRLHNFCVERNITLSCFGVLGSKGTPAEYKSSTTPVIDDALVKVMASGLGVSPAQLLIRYQIESGHNVVVKASSAAHMWDNLQALTFTLDKLQIDALHALNKNKRTFTFKGMGDTHKNYPFLSTY